MPTWISQVKIIFWKEVLQEKNSKFFINSMLLFSILLIFIIAFPFSISEMSVQTKIIIFWVILYFASTSGLNNTFTKEVERGTVLHIKILFQPQAVFWGKALFNTVSLCLVSLVIFFVYTVLFNFYQFFSFEILLILVMSVVPIGINGTLLATLIAQTSHSGVLYTIIGFPILFPIFILAINCMSSFLAGTSVEIIHWIFLFLYSIFSLSLSYLLFDFIWDIIH